MADIFISYKREDRARIAPLARAFESRGYTVWWDLELVAGQKWGKKIKAELDAAKCVVVAWTRASVAEDQTYASEWVENEADSGHRRGVLVPVLLDEGRIAWTHQRVQFAALIDWTGDPDHPGIADLMEGVSQHAGVRATPEAVELSAWTQAERTQTAEAFQDFLNAFPRSRFVEIARGRAAELEESAAWSALTSAPTIAELAGFLRRYPAGRFADDADAKIKTLEQASKQRTRAESEPPPVGAPPSTATPLHLPRWIVGATAGALVLVLLLIWRPWSSGESASNNFAPIEQSTVASGASVSAGHVPVATRREADAAPTENVPQQQARVQTSEPPPAQPGRSFRDCSDCPEMAPIPGQSFAAGVYEVTFAEWDACVTAGGCNGYRPEDQGWGRGRRPVINVNWIDAQAYVQWLSQRTGHRYRLLTSIEWEIAARAGATTNFSWGDEDPVCDQSARNGANFIACTDDRTRPVGSFQPNAFGLYDMHGNVWEWVQDCQNVERVGQACGYRGASWRNEAEYLSFAPTLAPGRVMSGALFVSSERRLTVKGFRVARIA